MGLGAKRGDAILWLHTLAHLSMFGTRTWLLDLLYKSLSPLHILEDQPLQLPLTPCQWYSLK